MVKSDTTYQFEGSKEQKIWLWRHSAITYMYDGKSLEEAVAKANKKYGVELNESLLFG